MTKQRAKERVAAYRAAQASQSTEVTLPSGAEVLLRRIPVQMWLMSGRFPTAFLNKAIQTAASDGEPDKQGIAQAIENALPAERMEIFKFMVDVARFCFVEPRLVDGADPNSDDEIDPSELSDLDFNYAVAWATNSLPKQPDGIPPQPLATDAVPPLVM